MTAQTSRSTSTQTYAVEGMTCSHCASAVTREVSALPAVSDVAVDVAAGTLTITAATPVDDHALRAAVDDAGYAVTGKVGSAGTEAGIEAGTPFETASETALGTSTAEGALR